MQSGTKPSSRIPGFYRQSVQERQALLSTWLDKSELNALTGIDHLPLQTADSMIENVVGTFAMPIGLALNFLINGKDVIVPMVVEEPSIVAGASFMARLARSAGGFKASSSAPEMIGQIQLLDLAEADLEDACRKIEVEKTALLSRLEGLHKTIQSLGGGARDLETKIIRESPIGSFIVLHLIYDVRDAMGANAVNTACELLAPEIEAITGGRVHLRILSNLTDRRMAKAACHIPAKAFAFDDYSGEKVVQGIIEAWAFAAVDPYRAATHNKGIMNGIDPVLIATGNDWRAVEAGAHAYAARDGRYTSLTHWSTNANGDLLGELEMPLSVGIVGGATKAHPGAQAALNLMDVKTAGELAEIAATIGLAQNLAALRALSTEGIQKGHMRLHQRKG